MISAPSYRSFLLRLWRETETAGAPWRGELEHIQSGAVVPVTSLDEVLRLLWREMAGSDEHRTDNSHDSPHGEIG